MSINDKVLLILRMINSRKSDAVCLVEFPNADSNFELIPANRALNEKLYSEP